MKSNFLLLLPILGLPACAGQHPVASDSSPSIGGDPLPDTQEVREPSDVHTYIVNDYVDPNNPRLLHRGHLVDAVEQDEKWKLRPVDDPATTSGPDTAVNDPNAAPNPYSAEFETELVQQREQSRQLAEFAARMTVEMGKLQDMTEKSADAVSGNASLRNRLEELQHEIDILKPSPTPPVAPDAPKKPSWLDSIWDLFKQAPKGTPVVEAKPELHTSLVLRPADALTAPPAAPTLPPVAPTNAPADPSPDPSIPSPGEMTQPDTNSAPQP